MRLETPSICVKTPLPLFCTLVLALALLFGLNDAQATEQPEVKQGHMDLSAWDFSRQGAVALDGQWEFFWGKLYSPEQLKTEQHEPSYFSIPGLWSAAEGHPAVNTEGVATYRVKVTLPATDRELGLRLKPLPTGYRLWVNDHLLLEHRKVGLDSATSKPGLAGSIISLPAEQTALDIVLQISNFHYRDAGIWTHIMLGPIKPMQHDREQQWVIDAFVIGAILIIGLYNLAMYFFRREDTFTLLLTLLCLVVAARTAVIGEVVIVKIWPDISWALARRLEFMGFYLAVPLFFSFLSKLYDDAILKLGQRLIWYVSLPFILLVTVMPVSVFSASLIYFHIFMIPCVLLLVKLLISELREKHKSAYIQLLAFGLIALSLTNDVLMSLMLISSIPLVHLGVMALILLQAILVARNFSSAFSRAENAENKIRTLNKNLEHTVNERTAELLQANHSVERKNRIFSSLLEASTAMHQTDDMSAFMEYILDKLKALFNHMDFALIIIGKREDIIKNTFFRGLDTSERSYLIKHLSEIGQPDYEGPWVRMLMSDHHTERHGMLLIRGSGAGHADLDIIRVFLEQVSAVEQNRRLTSELQRMAHTDSLTAAYNRAYFDIVFAEHAERTKTIQALNFSIITIDVNGLKRINDEFGHYAGDQLIINCYRLLRQSCRSSDIICRIGGDEFSIVCPTTAYDDSTKLLARIREHEQHYSFTTSNQDGDKLELSISLSIGMANSEDVPVEQMVRKADERLYVDKSAHYDKINTEPNSLN